MMDSSTNTLFHLLRSALGTQSAEGLPANVDWREVIDLSFEQGVAAIAVDGLQRNLESLPLTPPEGKGMQDAESLELALDSLELEDLKYEWFGSVFQAEEDYNKYLEDIFSLAKTYAEAGIEMMVLKGHGLSLNYPVPAHRPVGDVDVYLFNENENESDNRLPAWRRGGDEVIKRSDLS